MLSQGEDLQLDISRPPATVGCPQHEEDEFTITINVELDFALLKALRDGRLSKSANVDERF